MFKKTRNIIVYSLIITIFLQSCDFNRAKKIHDPTKKYERAMDYYEIGKYAKAQVMLEGVILSLRMTKNGKTALYTFADCHYKMKDYILAGYYFRKFVQDYPGNENAENAQFMSAKCYYLDAPKHKLDQQATNTALQEFEFFITKYPNSEKIEECNEYVDNLREKLELKSYENSKIYYDIGYFNGAAIAFKNNLEDYPDSKYKEDIYYYIFMSYYKYAKNSVTSKQEERYNDAISSYKKFESKFPDSDHLKEIRNLYTNALKEIEKLNSITTEDNI